MITVMKKMITVIKGGFSDILSPNHRNQKIYLLKQNHRNQYNNKKTMGQSIAEYTVLIAVIAAALLAMQIYMKRGIQSVVKQSTDQFGSQSEWLETDPDKVTQQRINMNSLSGGITRVQQDDAQINTTMGEMTISAGTSTMWKEDEL